MPSRTGLAVIVVSALALCSTVVSGAQTRLKGRVQTPGNNPLVAREQVTIDGAGRYTTQDDGEFEFDLAQRLKVGQPARFHVYHVNQAIKIRQWIVVRPCDFVNGRMDSLPDVGAEPVTIVVLPSGDPRLKSLNRDYTILGCIIEEAAAEFPPAPRSGGPNRSSLFDGGSSVLAERGPYRPRYKIEVDRNEGFPTLVEATYRLDVQYKPRGVPSSSFLGQASLARRAAELGFTPQELAEALNVWARSVEDRYQKGLAALYERRYAEASGYISASIPSPPGEFLKRYVPLARAEYEQGHYAAAETALRKVLAVHPEDPIVLNNLGVVLSQDAKYAEAEPLHQRALAIDEKALGPGHPDVATDLNSLAVLYLFQGKYVEAEPLLKRALAIDEKAFGPGHPDLSRDLDNLAEAYEHQGKYAEAEPLLKRAVTIGEKTLGPDHPDVATRLSNLASVYDDQGKYAEAEPLLKRALAIDEKALGLDHPKVAACLSNLASVYDDQGKYAEAEPLLKRALTIDEKALGPGHPDVATDLDNLASLYLSEVKYAEAEPLYKRALAVREKALGPDHPDVATSLNGLAVLYLYQGKYAEAEPLLMRALAIYEKALGPDHPKVAAAAENLAADLRKLGRDAEAKVYEDKAARIRARTK